MLFREVVGEPVPSSSTLVRTSEPTLSFTNAGGDGEREDQSYHRPKLPEVKARPARNGSSSCHSLRTVILSSFISAIPFREEARVRLPNYSFRLDFRRQAFLAASLET
jgi:hypothetical protein